jgi:methyl-accepting chemotaxis protein
MLDRLSANLLLKTVIAVLATAVVLLLAWRGWSSWHELRAADRTLAIADASGQAFRVLHNMRTERATVLRSLASADPITPDVQKRIDQHRTAGSEALHATAAILADIDFKDRATLYPELQRIIATLGALEVEAWEAVKKPKAARREALAKEFSDETQKLLATIDAISAQLTSVVKHTDPMIDEMFLVKNVAWMVRNAGGDASLMISNGIAAGKFAAADPHQKYTTHVAASEMAWSMIEAIAATSALPARVADAIAEAKKGYFEPEYTKLRNELFNAVLAGEKPAMTANEWAPYTVARLAFLQNVAEAALEAAKDHAHASRGRALRELGIELALLIAALALAFGSMLAVSRRVIGPLHQIRDAMLKVARGELEVEVGFAARRDEVGALAGALGTFKQNAVEKATIEAEQRQQREQTIARQQQIEESIGAFEERIREALAALANASTEMQRTSEGMSTTAGATDERAQAASVASADASANVQTVAAASEELSTSIAEISRQVMHAAEIAGRAVEETQRTDGTVQGLAEAAAKIGEVVSLISDIAGQTNLLALNATIEAARAGEAGKGFAVVASEVKSLATQTAKATEEISAQIAAVQNVTQEAVEAIQRIGGTISEVSSVATSIAGAVEEQGAATQEITRNTQEAARRTKDVAHNITGVTEGANATGAAAQEVRSAAETLGDQAEALRAEVGDFLAKIRAA